MTMFNIETKQQLSRILEDMINPVKIVCFFGKNDKSKETREFVTEFATFSNKISLDIYEDYDPAFAKEVWDVTQNPTLVVANEKNPVSGVRFLGTPGGYEINSFLMSILEVSGKLEPLSVSDQVIIDRIRKPLEIYSFVSLSCPQCPKSVMNIHRIAIQNNNIRAYMVESPAFKELVEEHSVQAFPTIKIGNKSLIGDNTKEITNIVQLIKEFI